MEELFQPSLDYALSKGAPEWFITLRKEALELYQTADWPIYERFPFKDWDLKEVTLDLMPVENWPKTPIVTNPDNKAACVRVGNDSVAIQLDEAWKEKGVIIEDLWTAIHDHESLVKEAMYQLKEKDHSMHAQLFAYLTAGTFVYIPKNAVLEGPVLLETWMDNTRKHSLMEYLLVFVEEGAQVEIFENLTSYGDQNNLANVFTHLVTRDNTKVDFVSIDQLGTEATAYLSGFAEIGRNSQMRWTTAALSKGNTLGDYSLDALKEGGEGELEILSVATGSQKKGFNTQTINDAQHTIGHILQHAAVLDEAFLSFNGITSIDHGAKFSDGRQTSRILMLSEKARGDVNPLLFIDQFEVTAGHSASAGQLDQDQLHYLMSRGISRRVAEQLVARGFLGVIIERIRDRSLQDEIIKVVDERLIGND